MKILRDKVLIPIDPHRLLAPPSTRRPARPGYATALGIGDDDRMPADVEAPRYRPRTRRV
ncbi:hypothetical protein LK09_00790 [Microbacterium mangrovi]|uniref:Uncharacterized protein n=1 Tax=Microbacterium mangrovi TaxID=1348253 RepID=A0A0B2A8M9_9MICO|nr:hypothetical protein LK09_00790 [Microbacterium mangrovi]